MSESNKKKTKENEDYGPEIKSALDQLDRLDESAEELGEDKYLKQLSLFENEFKELGMLQNILSRQGSTLSFLDRNAEAISKYEKAIELGDCNPRDRFILDCLCGLGECNYEIKQYDRAMVVFEEAESLLGLYIDEGRVGPLFSYYWMRGRTHQALEQYTEAGRWLREALKMVPDVNVSAPEVSIFHFDLASVYARDNNPHEALKALREVDEKSIDPDWISLYYSRKCWLLTELQLNTELVRVAEEFVRLNIEEGLAEAWYYFGHGNHFLGKEVEARRCMTNSLKFPDKDGIIHEQSRDYLSRYTEGWQ